MPLHSRLHRRRCGSGTSRWSVIARTAITDRRLLRSLGFLRIVRKASGELVEEIVTDEELDPSDVDIVEHNAPLVDPGDADPSPR